MSEWRAVGLNYINYSTICARLVRQALRQPFKTVAERRDDSSIRLTPWVDGKPQRHLQTGGSKK